MAISTEATGTRTSCDILHATARPPIFFLKMPARRKVEFGAVSLLRNHSGPGETKICHLFVLRPDLPCVLSASSFLHIASRGLRSRVLTMARLGLRLFCTTASGATPRDFSRTTQRWAAVQARTRVCGPTRGATPRRPRVAGPPIRSARKRTPPPPPPRTPLPRNTAPNKNKASTTTTTFCHPIVPRRQRTKRRGRGRAFGAPPCRATTRRCTRGSAPSSRRAAPAPPPPRRATPPGRRRVRRVRQTS